MDRLLLTALALAAPASACTIDVQCGPDSATVIHVVDGDTIDLDSGERVRYLMIDTPELTGGPDGASDCFGGQARKHNSDRVSGQRVTLEYDVQCADRYGRLLAYVSVGDVEVNSELVDRGYACALFIPPNGDERRDEFIGRETLARMERRGMWGACDEVACD